jgi:hypothetical protein
MRVTDGIEVDVSYQPVATPSAIRTDLGYRVRLDRAFFVVGQIELRRCDNFVAELWGLFAPARARAHVLETPTSLGEPLILDLMESVGIPEYAGTMKPPPGRYCSVRLVAMPADSDAVGLTDKNSEMTQHSVLVEGRAQGDEVVDASIEGPLEIEIELDEPLVLDRPTVEYIAIQIDHRRWFDGVDFAQLSTNAVQQRLIENVRSSLQAELPDWEGGP